MALSSDAAKRLLISVTSKTAGNEIVDALNVALAGGAQDLFAIPALIVATATSTTTDFAALAVGDKVAILPATAGNAQFVTVATAGTLPQAAVVGSLYVVIRAFVAPAASTQSF